MIFITGGTGFVGAHLLVHLAGKGQRLIAIRRKNASMKKFATVVKSYGEDVVSFENKIRWVEGDLMHLDEIFEKYREIDTVYHIAAMVSFDRKDREELYQTNVLGTRSLVDVALRYNVKRFCFVSSIAAIGRGVNQHIDESTEWKRNPKNTFYGISKRLAELEVRRGIEEGLNACIVNPGIILGPGEIDSGSTKMIKTVMDGLKFYPTGVNGFVDVRDVVKIMIRLTNEGIFGERFILVAQNLSYKALFEMIAKETSSKAPTIKVNYILAGLYCLFQRLKSWTIKKPPLLTRETMETSMSSFHYSNEKILTIFNHSFIPVSRSIKDTAEIISKK
jgi:nucleoside-diphosphate-sugar epimerase